MHDRYVKSLAKSLAESPSSFQGLRGTLGLLNGNEPLIRTEELVACTSEQFPISNGTLYLTDRHLIHQAQTLFTRSFTKFHVSILFRAGMSTQLTLSPSEAFSGSKRALLLGSSRFRTRSS